MENRRPLAGLTVLDMSQGIAGPSCGGHFAAYGARVIKIEPPEGDWIRNLGTRIAGTSPQAIVYNRGKESLALDLKSPRGRDVALTLAARSQVVIENARPGVMDRLGLGFEAVKMCSPGVVYVSVSGYGQKGPKREAPMVDTVGQAFSGLMSVTRGRDGSPVKIDATLIDAITGLYAFQAASMALWRRPADAPAEHLDISLMQASAHIQAPNILEFGFVKRPPGVPNPPAGNYRTRDGWLAITLVNETQFKSICRAIGQPDLAEDARFNSVAGRKANLDTLRALLDAALGDRDTDDWVARFTSEGALAARINSYGDWLDHPHVTSVGAAPPYRLSSGEAVPLPHLPAHGHDAAPVPGIGEHSRSILAEAGLSRDEIARLIADGSVVEPKSG